MQNYQKRVLAEKTELDEKLKKLVEFCQTETYKNLDPEDQKLLISQIGFMHGYSSILGFRIERFC